MTDINPLDVPYNTYRVVHLYNKCETYHLTREILLNSRITQDTYCFFYRILSREVEEFNDEYGSFACIISRNEDEADLYLNADSDALYHIVKYIQTGKIDGKNIYAKNYKTIDEIIDLATMLGMPVLVSMLRDLHPSEEEIESIINDAKTGFITTLHTLNWHSKHQGYDCIIQDVDGWSNIISNFFESHRSVVDSFIKSTMYSSNEVLDFLFTFISFCLNSTSSTHSVDPVMDNLITKKETEEEYLNSSSDDITTKEEDRDINPSTIVQLLIDSFKHRKDKKEFKNMGDSVHDTIRNSLDKYVDKLNISNDVLKSVLENKLLFPDNTVPNDDRNEDDTNLFGSTDSNNNDMINKMTNMMYDKIKSLINCDEIYNENGDENYDGNYGDNCDENYYDNYNENCDGNSDESHNDKNKFKNTEDLMYDTLNNLIGKSLGKSSVSDNIIKALHKNQVFRSDNSDSHSTGNTTPTDISPNNEHELHNRMINMLYDKLKSCVENDENYDVNKEKQNPSYENYETYDELSP